MSGSGFGPRVTPLRPPSWMANCQVTDKGVIIPNVHNCALGLEGDPVWTDSLRFDEMAQVPVLSGEPIEDANVFHVHRWFQTRGIPRMPLEAVREAIEIVARQRRFHPLRNFLDGLVWDGTPRLTDWLITYLGAPDNEYHHEIGARFLISMVARVFKPGCQCDYMLVLIGEQGEQKSQVCRTLASDAYFSSHLPDLAADPVRLSMHLRGKWLIEVAELAAFASNFTRAEHLKAFITRQVEQFTPKHARREVYEPRQCVLVGTHNETQFLRDETGNRRFWPVQCGAIDLGKLADDREHLFAEAVDAFRRGAAWWPERAFEKQFIEPVQQQHLWVDAWVEPIERYLDKQVALAISIAAFPKVTVSEVARDSDLAIPDGKLDQVMQKRIQKVLRSLRWKAGRTANGRFWSPP